jgi:hypothetical protein
MAIYSVRHTQGQLASSHPTPIPSYKPAKHIYITNKANDDTLMHTCCNADKETKGN